MTNEAIQNREPFLQNLREKLGVEKQPVSAHPFEPVNHLPEEQLADKTPAELLRSCSPDPKVGNFTGRVIVGVIIGV